MSWDVGGRRSLDLVWVWLWLWCRSAAVALIRPPSLGTSICCRCGPKKQKNKIKLLTSVWTRGYLLRSLGYNPILCSLLLLLRLSPGSSFAGSCVPLTYHLLLSFAHFLLSSTRRYSRFISSIPCSRLKISHFSFLSLFSLPLSLFFFLSFLQLHLQHMEVPGQVSN